MDDTTTKRGGGLPAQAVALFEKFQNGGQLTEQEERVLRRVLDLKPWHEYGPCDPELDDPPPQWMLKLPERLQSRAHVADLRKRLLEAMTITSSR